MRLRNTRYMRAFNEKQRSRLFLKARPFGSNNARALTRLRTLVPAATNRSIVRTIDPNNKTIFIDRTALGFRARDLYTRRERRSRRQSHAVSANAIGATRPTGYSLV